MERDTTAVVIYTRQSFDPRGEGLAVQRQEDACRALAQERGWTVEAVHTDNDVSATTGRVRPGFEAVLAQDLPVIVWHQDRLLRVSRDLERVLEAGLTVHTVQAGSFDLSNYQGRAVARTVAAWTTYEGEQKAARQRLSNLQRVQSGRPSWTVRPFGYERDGEQVPREAATVRAAYEAVLAGATMAGLARDWNAEGHLTTRGKPWTAVGVRAVLASPRYAGIIVHKGQEAGRGSWEPVVPEGTFRAVAALLAAPERGSGGRPRSHALTGLLRCGTCGRGMTGARRKDRPTVYRCPDSHVWYDEEPLTEALRDALRALPEPERVADPARAAEEHALSDAAHERATRLEQRLADLAEAYAADQITLQQMTTASERLREQIEREEGEWAFHAIAAAALTVTARKKWPGQPEELDLDRLRQYDVRVLSVNEGREYGSRVQIRPRESV